MFWCISSSVLVVTFAHPAAHHAAHKAGGNTGRSGGQPAGEDAHSTFFLQRSAHALCQQMAEAQQGNRGPAPAG